MLAALDGGPPRRTEGKDEARGRHEPREHGSLPGLVGRLARGIYGTIYPALGLLLRDTGSLRRLG